MYALIMGKNMKLCEYGCGQEALYFLKRSKKWCCSKSYNSCPISREKNRKKHLGSFNHRYGKHCTEETKNKIRNKNKNNIPWNKGNKNVYSDETLEKMRNCKFDSIPWNKGIPHSEETKNKISKSLKGNIPWNKGIPHSEETILKIKQNITGIYRDENFKKQRSKYTKNNRNPNWKGGYHINNIPTYDKYAESLTILENPERDIIDNNILTVLCAQCRRRFIPKLTQVIERVRSLNGTQNGENRIYCSEECKMSCSVFNKSIYQNGHPGIKNEIYTQQEYKIFRENVLQRDNYKCQYCGKLAEHVHHERPQKIEPFFSLDPDYAISVCKDCHYRYGHKDECSTGSLANKICK